VLLVLVEAVASPTSIWVLVAAFDSVGGGGMFVGGFSEPVAEVTLIATVSGVLTVLVTLALDVTKRLSV